MRIASTGGGPAGLYFSILLKQAFPAVEIDIYERNRPDDTFGWGVVFSDETLGNFEKADPESYKAITSEFRYWGEIDTYLGDACVRSTGHASRPGDPTAIAVPVPALNAASIVDPRDSSSPLDAACSRGAKTRAVRPAGTTRRIVASSTPARSARRRRASST